MVARLSVGEDLRVACDGCGAPVAAKVSFISPTAEYTPPVIYSRDQRARMVFMVEARPTDGAALFRVGQPVDVSIARP
jgi:HlyD family secretion protein